MINFFRKTRKKMKTIQMEKKLENGNTMIEMEISQILEFILTE